MKQINFCESPHHKLSTFSAHRIEIWDETFPTVEHAYHWRRFLPGPERETIKDAPSPFRAHEISQGLKKIEGLLDPKFDKLAVMEELFRAKLAQHPGVLDCLLETTDAVLVKEIASDRFWGQNKAGIGENHMGKLWMKLREDYTR